MHVCDSLTSDGVLLSEVVMWLRGVLWSVCATGGNEINDDCHMHVKLEGKLLPGQTYTSRPGRLPCKAVIHAVGPKWSGGRRNEENHLYMAVMNSMDEASHRGFQSIAIPAISAGIFGFPLDRATEIILTASRDHLTDQRGTSLKEVHIVDTDRQVISHFEASLKSMTVPSSPGPEEERSESTARRVRTPRNVDEATRNTTGESDFLLTVNDTCGVDNKLQKLSVIYLWAYRIELTTALFITCAKEGMVYPEFVCLSVCQSL